MFINRGNWRGKHNLLWRVAGAADGSFQLLHSKGRFYSCEAPLPVWRASSWDCSFGGLFLNQQKNKL